MSASSKVIVVSASADADTRAGRQTQLGFEREGIPTALVIAPPDGEPLELPTTEAGLVVVGGTDENALVLLREARARLEAAKLDIPILFAGKGVRRTDAEAAGADEIVLFPAFLRDVVTVGRLLRGQPAAKREHIIGSLVETTNVFTLVRALAALGRSAVLTLVRGLRRGEIRFFHGEVTSAELAAIHGQAALHQLLLWTEARFEFLHEDVVRRQQIPMTHAELFTDAERFLEGVRDSSGSLSPAMVLEQDVQRLQSLGRQVPTEVHGVLRMFDGHRVLADILEDSPYRVFETLRVTQRAVDAGLLRVVASTRPKATWRAVLGIEEWLTGQARDQVVERAQADIAQGALGSDDTKPSPKRKKRSTDAPASRASRSEIDWGALVPRIVGAEVGSLSTVVPAAQRSGEISLPTMREEPREKLESLMNTAQREKIFPKDLGEPSVVLDAREMSDDDAVKTTAFDRFDPSEVEPSVPTVIAVPTAAASGPTTKSGKTRGKKDKSSRKSSPKLESKPVAKVEPKKLDAPEVDAATEAALRKKREDDAEVEDARLRAEAASWTKKAAAARQEAVDQEARDGEELAKRLADAKARAETGVDEEALWRQAEDRARTTAAGEETRPVPRVDAEELVRELRGEKVTVAETPGATVVVQDTLTVAGSAGTAVVTSTPTATVTEAPLPIEDDPSDGIVRHVPTVETAPLARKPPTPPAIPPDDRPDPAMGEIEPRARDDAKGPRNSEPSILIEDLAAAHSAVAAVATAQAAVVPTADLSTSPLEITVAEVRKDAVATFSDAEEAFFRAGSEKEKVNIVTHTAPIEKFDDLDDDYQPVGFWDRLRGKKPPPK